MKLQPRISYFYDGHGRAIAAVCRGLVGEFRPQDNRAIKPFEGVAKRACDQLARNLKLAAMPAMGGVQ